MSFTEALRARRVKVESSLCIGLDPDPSRLPDSVSNSTTLDVAITTFCREIIEATASQAAAFKFNLAFFEAIGQPGYQVLTDILSSIPDDVLTIADAKRGDVGNSARFYAKALLEDFGFDSVTVSPYMGSDSVLPFLQVPGKAAFILARTSNPGGNDFQALESEGIPLYQRVATRSLEWEASSVGTAGLVAGATDLDCLAELRRICPDTPFLIPGVGAQGASAADVMNVAGSGPVLVNSSRQIIYASSGADYARAAAEAASNLRAELARGFSTSL